MSLDTLKPQEFFEEYIWVVYASGFSVRRLEEVKDRLYRAYGRYKDLDSKRKRKVLAVVNSVRKWNAVHDTAVTMQTMRWDHFKKTYLSDLDKMTALGYIGPITKFHLGRNLGFNVAKPDRHLVTLAERFGCSSVDEMCQYLSQEHSLKLKEIDFILWKFRSEQRARGL